MGPHFQLLGALLHALFSKTVILMGMSVGAGGREYGAAGRSRGRGRDSTHLRL